MKTLIHTCFALMLMLFCASCSKVIDVKLDDSVSQVIIEGEITNNKGPYTITVTESVNFGETNNFPGRDDATVIIQDLTGNTTETLTSKGDGTYQTAKLLGVSLDKVIINIDKYGNTSAATIPIAFHEAVASGKIKRGDTVLFDAFGAGLTSAATLFIY